MMNETMARAAIEAAVTRKVNEFGTKGLKTYAGAHKRLGLSVTMVDWMIVLNQHNLFVPVVLLKQEQLHLCMAYVNRGCFVTTLESRS